MTTVGTTPDQEAFAADPSTLSTEVADYSHVPPTVPYSTVESNSSRNLTTIPNSSIPPSRRWDYAQKGGADFNMEAPILAEDVVRAGGLGARDEVDRFLPAAVDATDYEESLNQAMEYEDVPPAKEGEIPRPGVGFVKDQQQQIDHFREVN